MTLGGLLGRGRGGAAPPEPGGPPRGPPQVDLLRAEPREHDAPAPPAPSPTSRGRHHRRAASDERGELREPDGKSRNSQLSPRRAASGSASMSAFQFDASSEQRQPSSESPKRRGTAASRPSSALQESAGTSLRRCTTVSSVQDLRRCGQSQQEELVVVIVCNGEAWQQVKTVVDGLMAPYQPFRR
ncbi:unnamed protein product, partial [Prorocentrum cordatum]